MMTTLAGDPALTPPDDSALGVPLRAESAAKGETEFDLADAGGSLRRTSVDEASTGRGVARTGAEADAASLSNCSMGSRRCACAIFSSPSSRWKRCS